MEKDNESAVFHIDLSNELEGTLGYRLSTTKNVNGAVAIFYPGVKERLGELMGGDYLIGFTSVHEAIIHPAKCQNPLNMQESIEDINNVFPRDEMLTNEVYRYYVKEGVMAVL